MSLPEKMKINKKNLLNHDVIMVIWFRVCFQSNFLTQLNT